MLKIISIENLTDELKEYYRNMDELNVQLPEIVITGKSPTGNS